MFNKIQLIGRLAKDNTFKATTSGVDICENTLALTKKTKDGEKSIFIKIKIFGAVCDIMRRYTNKGDKIGIIGELDYNEWLDKDNRKQYQHSVIVENIELLGKSGKSSQPQQANNIPNKTPAPSQTSYGDDEIPF